MRSFHEQQDFKALLLADADIATVLPAAEIEKAFDLKEQLRNVDAVFARVFGTRRSVEGRNDDESARLCDVEAIGVRSAGPRRRRRARHARLPGRKDVRQGKFFEVELEAADRGDAEARVTEMADKLLANPVIESYRVEVSEPGLTRAAEQGTRMKFSVVVFPGSNSDYDAFYAASAVLGEQAALVWHKDTDLNGADAVILPGGFAHGDYLRTGAIARFSPIMGAVKAFADRGGPVLGICNGFQVLLEAGLLPGAMVRNGGIKFVSRMVPVRVEQTDTPFTRACAARQVLHLPIAHGEGNYYAAARRPRRRSRPIARSSSATPTPPARSAPAPIRTDRSTASPASATPAQRRRPDAASRARLRAALGSADGRVVLQSVVKAYADGVIAGRPALIR